MFFSSYIKKRHFLLFLFLEFLFLFFGLEYLAKFLVLIFLILLYLLRIKHLYNSDVVTDEGLILSPINGKILEIREAQDYVTILVAMPWSVSYGIYAPTTCTVEDYQASYGSDIFRHSDKDTFLNEKYYRGAEITLKSDLVGEIKIKCFKCVYGLFPDFWVRQGDKIYRKAVVGLIPFGGTVSVTISTKYEIIPKIGDQLLGGTSIIGRPKII